MATNQRKGEVRKEDEQKSVNKKCEQKMEEGLQQHNAASRHPSHPPRAAPRRLLFPLSDITRLGETSRDLKRGSKVETRKQPRGTPDGPWPTVRKRPVVGSSWRTIITPSPLSPVVGRDMLLLPLMCDERSSKSPSADERAPLSSSSSSRRYWRAPWHRDIRPRCLLPYYCGGREHILPGNCMSLAGTPSVGHLWRRAIRYPSIL
ncbi:hypothetical protein N658DRAFT_491990 [Parathielavia hyrcaniae]|uniref:Uncharacterized protein n=1 Tax=Parathielavia hyrcaniae TaxID=113614 RepID=A0AAN6Q9P8_9PEZI|nr:hypothetical protein N658DRAFT_491990 [Parathielavia hyrcaniae]